MAGKKKAAQAKRDAVDTALELAAVQGWRHTGLADIAAAAGLTLAELFAAYPGKPALLREFFRRVDRAMLAADAADGSPRDRLFAIVMARFDALAPHKPALRKLVREATRDPALAATLACGLPRALTLMLELAGLSADGVAGALRRKGLGLVYADTFRLWLADDSEDQGKTMAALDKRLARAESIVTRMRGMRPDREAPAV